MSKCEYCEPYEKTCGVKCPRPTCSTNWPCTRAAGHEGDHVACGPTQCEIERWPNETPDADTDVPVVLTAPGYYAESLLTMREMADGIKVIRKAIERAESINETEEDTSPVDDAYLIADLQQRLLKSQREAVEQHNVDGQLIASLKKQVAQAIELQGELAQATMRIEYLEMVRAVNTENGSMP